MSHTHEFNDWPFEEPTNTAVFTTRHVLSATHPILEVYHDHDGDWQFLCGTTQDIEDLKLVCMGCMLERDSTLATLADLPVGWCATRESAAGGWSRSAFEDSDED